MAAYAARTLASRRGLYSCPGAWRWCSARARWLCVLAASRLEAQRHRPAFKRGDILLSLDGAAVTGTDDLTKLLGAERIGRETSVSFLRGGELQVARATSTNRTASCCMPGNT